MEKHKDKPGRLKRGGVDELKSNASIPGDTGELGQQRENSAGRADESGSATEKPEGVAILGRVKAGLWEDHKNELDRIQRQLALSTQVRVARATVNSKTAPEIHETGHGEIKITIGDEFTALLTDGTTLRAA